MSSAVTVCCDRNIDQAVLAVEHEQLIKLSTFAVMVCCTQDM